MRWLRRMYLRTCSMRQLREERAEGLLAKADVYECALLAGRMGLLEPAEQRDIAKCDAWILLVDLELQRRGAL